MQLHLQVAQAADLERQFWGAQACPFQQRPGGSYPGPLLFLNFMISAPFASPKFKSWGIAIYRFSLLTRPTVESMETHCLSRFKLIKNYFGF